MQSILLREPHVELEEDKRFIGTNREENVTLPFFITLIIITLFLPVELSFYIFGLRLTLTRLIFLAITPYLFIKLIGKVVTGPCRFVLSDFFFLFASIWMIYAPSNIDGIIPAINHAGPEVLEFLIAYLSTRTLLTKPGQALKFISLLCKFIAVIAFIGLIDPITDHYFIRDLAKQLTGYPNYFDAWEDRYRLGLLRASSTLEHPILFGFVCTIGILLSASITMKWRGLIMVTCVIGAVAALSSAPVQSLIMGLVLLWYARLASPLRYRWTFLIALGAAAIFSAFVISNNPLGFIFSNLIMDPNSGYYRYWTWETVLTYLSQSPWYGLGRETLPDEINHSIDSVWLVLSIHSGYPGAILTFFCLVSPSSLPTSGADSRLTSEEARLGTMLGIITFLIIFMGFTVHFWGCIWVLIGLLAGTRAHLGELSQFGDRVPPKTRSAEI